MGLPQRRGATTSSAAPIRCSIRGLGQAAAATTTTIRRSSRLVVMDRDDRQGAVDGRRRRAASATTRICIGGGRLYCIDRLSGPELSRLKRRGEDSPQSRRGWSSSTWRPARNCGAPTQDVFGTWLSYSAKHDVLVEAGRVAATRSATNPRACGPIGPPRRRRPVGQQVVQRPGHDPPRHDPDGRQRLRPAHRRADGCASIPLTGEPVEWTWSRNYGCNTPMASEHLLTFRSGAAGYFDLCNDGGTGNFGGFRSSCTNNLIVAGGLLDRPRLHAHLHLQLSESDVARPGPHARGRDVDLLRRANAQGAGAPARHQLGAPGDRKADDGTLWLEYPSVGGNVARRGRSNRASRVEWFRRHSSQVDGPGLKLGRRVGREGADLAARSSWPTRTAPLAATPCGCISGTGRRAAWRASLQR